MSLFWLPFCPHDSAAEPDESRSSQFRSESQATTSSNEHVNDCNAQCCQDTLEVFQVIDESVVKRTIKVQGHSRQFCPEWYRSYPWLVLCTTRLKAFCARCRYCVKRRIVTDKLGEPAFVSVGFSSWKKSHSTLWTTHSWTFIRNLC